MLMLCFYAILWFRFDPAIDFSDPIILLLIDFTISILMFIDDSGYLLVWSLLFIVKLLETGYSS